jgi:hypothetical protein
LGSRINYACDAALAIDAEARRMANEIIDGLAAAA